MTKRQRFENAAEKRFEKHLGKAIEAMYEAGIENRGDVLSLDIKSLHFSITTNKETKQ